VSWQAIGTRASDRLIAIGARLRPNGGRLLTGAVRGLLVSPWFAAGAGFVVAAGAFMYAPHAQLSFGNALISRSPCTAVKCQHQSTTAQGAPGMPAGTGIEQVSPSPTPSPTAVTTDLTFGYTVIWQNHGTFAMVLTVTAKKAIGNWNLSFVIPGATNVTVVQATSYPTQTASPTASQTPGSSRTKTPDGQPSSGPSAGAVSDHGADQTDSLSLLVEGDGTPVPPGQCTFNGTTCDFTKITSA
jgi:hypothetical protein